MSTPHIPVTAAEVLAYRDEHCVSLADAKAAVQKMKAAQMVAPQPAPSAEPVAVHQWRKRGDNPWHDAPEKQAFSRVDEVYEARTLYAAPQPDSGRRTLYGADLLLILHTLQDGECSKSRAAECIDALLAGTFTPDWLPEGSGYFDMDDVPAEVVKQLKARVSELELTLQEEKDVLTLVQNSLDFYMEDSLAKGAEIERLNTEIKQAKDWIKAGAQSIGAALAAKGTDHA